MSKKINELAECFYEPVNNGGELSEVLSDDFIFGIMPGFSYGGDQNGLQPYCVQHLTIRYLINHFI